ncbi:MAG: hypothetical protein ACRETX_04120, partial [Steroidobacteraceae bacterium]
TTTGSNQQPAAGAHDSRSGMMAQMCPMQVVGATVTAEPREHGAALVFTTPTGEVAELQRRVRHMAERMAGGKCPMMDMGSMQQSEASK